MSCIVILLTIVVFFIIFLVSFDSYNIMNYRGDKQYLIILPLISFIITTFCLIWFISSTIMWSNDMTIIESKPYPIINTKSYQICELPHKGLINLTEENKKVYDESKYVVYENRYCGTYLGLTYKKYFYEIDIKSDEK